MRLTVAVIFVVFCGACRLEHHFRPASVPALQAQAVQQAPATRIDADRLVRDLQALASPEFEGRLPGSAGSLKAQALIAARFKDLGIRPVNGSYQQTFSFSQAPGGGKPMAPDATNLMGLVSGTVHPQSFIVVSAHYDHLGVRDGQTYHGADDNASGVAALLAIAAWFAAHPPRRSVLFVAFDAEEQGLLGAKHFIRNPPIPLDRIAVAVNMDMIGRGDANRLFVAGTYQNPSLKPMVGDAAKGSSLRVAFGHDKPSALASRMDDWTNLSDHGAFHAAGIPFLYFGVEDHADYHKPSDTADKIPRRFFQEAAELILETVRRLANRI
jgi:hypothetical protein